MEVFDVVIIGSGFGGSVSAMRWAQKGYSVAVIETGRRYCSKDFPKSNWNVKKYFWFPFFRCFGFQKITFLRKVMLLHGVGVGGGSLVYAATLPRPLSNAFSDPSWPSSLNWKDELAPWYETAEAMLGVTRNPKLFESERILEDLAGELGAKETFCPTDVGIYFDNPGKTVSDPFFGGAGPHRTGCLHCGACMIGCPLGAKNTLDFNYLYFAELWGAQVFPETTATVIHPSADGQDHYVVESESSTSWFPRKGRSFRAKNVILAAGVLGTVELLLKNRDVYKTLPQISRQLGEKVRTNGECLLGATSLESNHDLSKGIAIGAAIHPNEDIKIEQVRYPKGSSAMRLLAVPLTGEGNFVVRPLKLLANLFLKFPSLLRLWTTWDWASRTVILLVMQTIDTKLRLTLSRSVFRGFRKVLTGFSVGAPMPTYMPLAQKAAEFVAKRIGGVAQNAVSEVLLGTPLTAHILGGTVLADSPEKGVVDTGHQVFAYKGLYVCDGSVVPANLGANPSLTITALAERFCSLIPRHPDQSDETFEQRVAFHTEPKARRAMKPFGWGDQRIKFDLQEHPDLKKYLKNKFGISSEKKAHALALSEIPVGETQLPTHVVSAFRNLLGDPNVRWDQESRLLFSGGKSFKDLIRLRLGNLTSAPDLVLVPAQEEQLSDIFRLCETHDIALIPFGGGTSVVGGLDALRGSHRYAASLDMTRFNKILECDTHSHTVTVQAGVYGADLEAFLNERGLTLGHFPQSFEYTTVGGWLATRSSGQNSLRYGNIASMVLSVSVRTPSGSVHTVLAPNMATGPDMKQLFVGMEGVFGVITACSLRVSILPERKIYLSYLFRSFEESREAARRILQSEAKLAMVRVSDEDEMELMTTMLGSGYNPLGKRVRKLGMSYLKKIGYPLPRASIMMIGHEGTEQRIAFDRILVSKAIREIPHRNLGEKAGEKWLKERFFHPYVRDALLDQELMVDTLETATTWDNLENLYLRVKGAIESICRSQKLPVVVLCHLSHLYETGSSLYFTFICQQTDDPLSQWERIKNAASQAIVDGGGVISHHHGVGTDHRNFLIQTPVEKSLLRAMKKTLDPHEILNPEKLL